MGTEPLERGLFRLMLYPQEWLALKRAKEDMTATDGWVTEVVSLGDVGL